MNAQEMAQQIKDKTKNKQMSKEVFEELVEWCSNNLKSIDLENQEQAYLFKQAVHYLMKPNQVLEWDEKDAKVIISYFANKGLKQLGISDKATVEILSQKEFEERGNKKTTMAVCIGRDDDTYDLEYSPQVIESLLSRKTGEILRGFQTIFHEVTHVFQNTTIRREKTKGPEAYMMAMETLARRQAPEMYDANYEHLLKENNAEKLGLELAMINIREMAPELYSLYKQDKIQAMKAKYDKLFYEGKIDLYGSSRKASAQIDKACSQYISKHPEVLKRYPVLQMGFNLDGTKKELLQLLAERQQFIDDGKPIELINNTYRTVMNYKNYVKDTPGGTKEEIQTLCDYTRETGTEDEFIWGVLQYRLENTTLPPSEIEAFIKRERNEAAKTRKEKGEKELQQEQEESIKDEVGDEFKQKSEAQEQEEQQVKTMWQNRFQAWDRKSITLPNADKKKEEAVKAMQDVEREHIQEEKLAQQQLEEQENQGR